MDLLCYYLSNAAVKTVRVIIPNRFPHVCTGYGDTLIQVKYDVKQVHYGDAGL